MNNFQKILNAINSDNAIAEDVLYRALAYREFKDDLLGFISAHEYGLKDGIAKYRTAKECHCHLVKLFGEAVDYILDEFYANLYTRCIHPYLDRL